MRPFRPSFLAAALCLLLAACGMLPPATMAALATLDPLTMKPGDVRVVVTFPDGIRLKPGDVVMDVGWKEKDSGREIKRHFALELVTGNAAAPAIGRMLRPDERLYLLMLTPRDAESFQALQQEVIAARDAGRGGTGTLSVGFAGGCTADPALKAGPLKTSVLLRPDGDARYLPIFADMDLMDTLRRAGLKEVPECTDDYAGPARPQAAAGPGL